MAENSPLQQMAQPSGDPLAAVIGQVVTAIVQRFVIAKPKDPYQARMDYLDRQLARLEKTQQDHPELIEQARKMQAEAEAQMIQQPAAVMGTVKPQPLIRSMPDDATDDFSDIPRPLGSANTREELGVGCLPCARAHFTAIWGSLDEALRFARDEGIAYFEVITRMQSAEKEALMVERHDWTPAKIANSPVAEQEVLRYMLPKLRELRQDIVDIASVDDLESATAKAEALAQDLHIQVLKLKGINAERLSGLAKQVQNGEKTIEQAGRELRDQISEGEDCPICKL